MSHNNKKISYVILSAFFVFGLNVDLINVSNPALAGNLYSVQKKQTSQRIATLKENSILNELERSVFKRPSTGLAFTQRLDKLEIKLFGQTSPNMTTAKRIERLKETVGLADAPNSMAQLPYQYPSQLPMLPNTMIGPDIDQFESQMSQMFQQMQKQMPGDDRDFEQIIPLPGGGQYQFHYRVYGGPGQKEIPNKPGQGLNKGLKMAPRAVPMPQMPQKIQPENLPPYSDPNFI